MLSIATETKRERVLLFWYKPRSRHEKNRCLCLRLRSYGVWRPFRACFVSLLACSVCYNGQKLNGTTHLPSLICFWKHTQTCTICFYTSSETMWAPRTAMRSLPFNVTTYLVTHFRRFRAKHQKTVAADLEPPVMDPVMKQGTRSRTIVPIVSHSFFFPKFLCDLYSCRPHECTFNVIYVGLFYLRGTEVERWKDGSHLGRAAREPHGGAFFFFFLNETWKLRGPRQRVGRRGEAIGIEDLI